MMKTNKVSRWAVGALLITLASFAQAGIEYSIRKADTASTYTVYARASEAVLGVNAMVSGAQVSIMMPLNAKMSTSVDSDVVDVNSGDHGLWQVNSWNGSTGSGDAGQSDHPNHRIMSVGQVAAGARIIFSQVGEELALFDFSVTGCQLGDALRIANNQDDPDGLADAITAVPNSAGSNASNSWTNLKGEQYDNNYPVINEGVSCQ